MPHAAERCSKDLSSARRRLFVTLLKTVLQGLDKGRKGEQKPGYLGLRNWWEVREVRGNECLSVSLVRRGQREPEGRGLKIHRRFVLFCLKMGEI